MTTMEPCPLDQHVFDAPCEECLQSVLDDMGHKQCSSCGALRCHECDAVVILVAGEWLHQDPSVKPCFVSDTLRSVL